MSVCACVLRDQQQQHRMESQVVRPAVLSGVFAAVAAVFGKLCTSPTIGERWWHACGLSRYLSPVQTNYLLWSFQLVSLVLMFASNAVMWSQFSLALAHSQVTLSVTVINTITNFLFTAAFGYLLFGEQITVQWAVGITFLLIGMTLLKTTDAKDEAKKKKKKK